MGSTQDPPVAEHAETESRRPLSAPVTLIGSYPPPYGGVSVHIKRLMRVLGRRGVPVTLLADPGSGGAAERVVPTRLGPAWYTRRLLSTAADLLHLHTSGVRTRRLAALSLLAARGQPVVVTLHSLRDAPAAGRVHAFPALCLRRFPHIICVGPEIRDQLMTIGVSPDRASVIPSYLPPDLDDAERRRLDPEVDRFLRSHRPILTANAYRLVFHRGEDLYGLDLCVETCRRLLAEHPALGFVFALPEVGDEAYFAAMRARIRGAGLADHFFFSRSAAEYWPIVERASLLLRPTNTDSYGVSVAEAIDLGVPAIASDVCRRPPGTILFRNRSLDSLLEQTRRVLAEPEIHRRRLAGHRRGGADTVDRILEVYRSVLRAAAAGAASSPPR